MAHERRVGELKLAEVNRERGRTEVLLDGGNRKKCCKSMARWRERLAGSLPFLLLVLLFRIADGAE